MRHHIAASKRVLWAVALAGITFLPLTGCAPGSVYVGVAAPGPWVGYPVGGYYPPGGYYGRPWYYTPNENLPDGLESPIGPPEAWQEAEVQQNAQWRND